MPSALYISLFIASSVTCRPDSGPRKQKGLKPG
jgi:hypothetical protein